MPKTQNKGKIPKFDTYYKNKRRVKRVKKALSNERLILPKRAGIPVPKRPNMSVVPLPDPSQVLVITQKNAMQLIQRGLFTRLNKTKAFTWHKFKIVNGAEFDREVLLKTIVNLTGDIFPVQYVINGGAATFLAKNCNPAIEIMMNKNMTLQYPDGRKFNIIIHLNGGEANDTTNNITELIQKVLQRRFNKQSGVLNLENLVADTELAGKVYCALSNQAILVFVLSITRGWRIKTLLLNNNELPNIDGLDSRVWAFNTLDLRNNLIEDISCLDKLTAVPVKDIKLEGNPLCAKYDDETSYINAIREICLGIEVIDGKVLNFNSPPMFRRNFLVDAKSQEFVDQFLEQYFTMYDSRDRHILLDIYHKKALFSLTCAYIPGQITSTMKLDVMRKFSRNLLSISDYSKSDRLLSHGASEVVEVLCKLPPTEHDPFSFTVDLIYRSEISAVIVVSGVFREVNPANNSRDVDKLLGFGRTFVLKQQPDGAYNITNDELHVSNAVTLQAQRAFKNPTYINPLLLKRPSFTQEEKICLIETFARISTLNMEYAKKILEDNNWNLKQALEVFVDSFKDARFGPEAFKIT